MTPDVNPQTVILVPSTSAARLFRAQIYRQHLLSDQAVMDAPALMPLSAWLKQLWNQVPVCGEHTRPVLLTAGQERAVWQDIIRASKWSAVLMQVGSLARNASQAFRLMRDWDIGLASLKVFTQDESRALQAWCAAFDRACRQNSWLPEIDLPAYLLELPQDLIDWPRQLQLAGFDTISPAQKRFFDQLAERGCEIQGIESGNENRNCQRTVAVNTELEYRYAANWAKQRLAAEETSTIAIALPDLNRHAGELTRVLDRVLGSGTIYRLPMSRPYQCMASASLDSHPLIDIALVILGQSRYRIELSAFGRIAGSGFIAGADEELLERARLDAHLRKLGELTPSLGFIAAQIVDKESGDYRFNCPLLYRALHDWRRSIDALPKSQTPSEWAGSFSQLLAALGWPARGGNNTDIMNRWNDALSQLCALDAVTMAFDIESALQWLRRIASETGMPTQTADHRLSVIGIDDAAVAGFDHLWVCGLDDEHWPPAARPNPLLPLPLQRDAGIPDASSKSVAEQAKRLIRRLRGNSVNIVFSHAQVEGDRALQACPSLDEFDPVEIEALVAVEPSVAEILFDGRQLELQPDRNTTTPADLARGGTSILKDQAACPFRAQVKYRLAAVAPEEPEPGLDAAERGTLLHEVLAIVWTTLGSHSGLMEADEGERERLVQDAARVALEKMVWKKPETITPRFLDIELERLTTRVMSWLYFEEARDSFTVLTPEAERRYDLAGLELSMRIDRIDRNEFGERIVIDYKTGDARVSSWFGERPDEPQLPLYALTEIDAGHEVAAIGFAQLRPNDIAFKGIAARENALPGVAVVERHRLGKAYGSWDNLLQTWKTDLTRLAQDFVGGVATVDPKSADSCKYCEFGGICRIQELNQRAGIAATDDAGAGGDDE